MATWDELMEVYRSLAAHKKRLGNEMGRAEAKLEKLEVMMALSHLKSMDLRREAWEYVKMEELI